MSRWFRHYAGMMADPKFGAVARRAKATRAEVLFIWGCILEDAAERESAGYVWDADLCAELLNCETEHAQRVHDEMERSGLVADGRVTSWDRRQFVSDTSTERSRKHREAKRNTNATSRNVAASPPETETELSEANASGEAAPLPVSDPDPAKPERDLFDRGREMFGPKDGGGVTNRVLKAKGGNVALARASLEEASQKSNPRQWLEATIHSANGTRKPFGGPDNAGSVHGAAQRLVERMEKSDWMRPEGGGTPGRHDVRMLAQGGRG